jgi:Tol biopolymer transport system component
MTRYWKVGALLTGLAAIALRSAPPAAAQQSDGVLLQQAMHAEQVDGNLQQAITLYQRILAQHPADREVDAKAQLHIGLCYENLGLAEARRAYQQVIANYADQAEEVREARAHLAALQPAAVAGRGPVARRLLGPDDINENDLIEISVSPDGRRVAYSRLGSDQALIVRDLTTGEEQLVDSGLPCCEDFYPVWSSDGKRIAFHHDDYHSGRGAVRIIDLDTRHVSTVPGTSFQINEPAEHHPSFNPVDWSRDGLLLLCRTSGGWQPGGLVLVPVDGGAIVPVTDSVAPENKASISPDGRFVAYSAGPKGDEQVFVQPVAGGARRQITDAPGGNSSPMWSPDGRDIAFGRSDGIWMVAVRNGQRAGSPVLSYASSSYPGKIFGGWTAAGGLYFSAFNNEGTAYRLAVDPSTGQPTGSPAEHLPSYPKNLSFFSWSPDMQRIAFGGAWNSSDITIYNVDRQELAAHRVDPPPERVVHSLDWIEGGREVVYLSVGRDGSRLAALNPVTGHVRELPVRAHHGRGALSPDGRRIAYQGPGGIYVADTGQADGVLVAARKDPAGAGLGGWVTPKISPKGDRLLFSRDADMDNGGYDTAASTLWIVGTDGTGARKVGTPMYIITSAVWDPSGRFIAYTGQVDSTTLALRVVNVATGAVRDFPLPDTKAADEVQVTDWSPDGRYLGVVDIVETVEYWVLQGLQGGQR